jgi:Phosphate-induced protein 1 conserved region
MKLFYLIASLGICHCSVVPLRNAIPPNVADNDILYNIGGAVITGYANVHLIYYGTFSYETKVVLENLISGIGVTPWWDIMNQYYYQAMPGGAKSYVSDVVRVVKTVQNMRSRGSSLSGNIIPEIIEDHINRGDLVLDTHGVYMFLMDDQTREQMRPDIGTGHFCQGITMLIQQTTAVIICLGSLNLGREYSTRL